MRAVMILAVIFTLAMTTALVTMVGRKTEAISAAQSSLLGLAQQDTAMALTTAMRAENPNPNPTATPYTYTRPPSSSGPLCVTVNGNPICYTYHAVYTLAGGTNGGQSGTPVQAWNLNTLAGEQRMVVDAKITVDRENGGVCTTANPCLVGTRVAAITLRAYDGPPYIGVENVSVQDASQVRSFATAPAGNEIGGCNGTAGFATAPPITQTGCGTTSGAPADAKNVSAAQTCNGNWGDGSCVSPAPGVTSTPVPLATPTATPPPNTPTTYTVTPPP
ncbi:MAG: hypothetical protein ACYDGM_13595 [Vulcanimicrobiaceae bacterium]